MPFPLSSFIAFSFLEDATTHAAQDVRRLGELDVVVADDLYTVAPWVEEIEKLTWQRFYARLRQGVAHGLFVIDNESKMTAVVGGLGGGPSEELGTDHPGR